MQCLIFVAGGGEGHTVLGNDSGLPGPISSQFFLSSNLRRDTPEVISFWYEYIFIPQPLKKAPLNSSAIAKGWNN